MSQVSGASSFRSTAQFDLQKITECRAPIVSRTSPDRANPNVQPYHVHLLPEGASEVQKFRCSILPDSASDMHAYA